MITFNEHQTQAQIATALAATSSYTKVGFCVVGADTQYATGSVTVQLIAASGDIVGYRTLIASEAAAKTYIASLVSTYSLASKFNFATIDDGQGIEYTVSEVESW